MKPLFLILLLSLTFNSFAQTKKYYDRHDVYTGVYLSNNLGNLAFVQYENDGELALIRFEYLTDFRSDNRFYMKLSVQLYEYKNFRFLTSLPPFYYSFAKHKYNTPINFEIQYKRKLLLNVDFYRDVPNISLRFRHKF